MQINSISVTLAPQVLQANTTAGYIYLSIYVSIYLAAFKKGHGFSSKEEGLDSSEQDPGS